MAKPRWWQSNLNLSFLGSVAVAVVAAAILNLFGLLPHWLVTSWHWLVHPVPVPLLALGVMLGAVGVLTVGVVQRFRKPAPPPWLSYRQASFLGMTWKWNYDSKHAIVASSLTAYCPQCATGLPCQYDNYESKFICDECDFRKDFEGSYWSVRDRVVRLIEREVNQRLAPRT